MPPVISPAVITPVVVTPELTAAALASEAMTAVRLAGPKEPGLEAWLCAISAPLKLPDDEGVQWLAAVTLLASADRDIVVAEEVRDAVFGAVDDEEADARADAWLADWVLFGALVPAGGSLRITALGRLLADSVTAMLAPAPDETAAAVVTRFTTLPVRVAVGYLAGWLAARTPVAAASELIDFAAAATPHERAIAIDLAAEIGPDAAPAWRERARLPGYGVYVREWLADQGEKVPDVPGDKAWMAAETFSMALDEAPSWLGDGKVAWAMEEALDPDDGDPVTLLKASGHPDAARLIKIVEAGA